MAAQPADESSESALRGLLGTAAIVAVFLGTAAVQVCSGTRPAQPVERCEALFDRFVELRERAANPKASPGDLEARKSQARESAERSEALQDCQERLTEDTLSCAEAAMNADQLEQCFP